MTMAKMMFKVRNLLVAVIGAVLLLGGATIAQASPEKPTIVLLHGAFADGSSWSKVTSRLQSDGYTVVAPAVQLRGSRRTRRTCAAYWRPSPDPKVLVGHSYGGALVSQLADTPGVKSLVYVAAFIPEAGETLGALNSQFPGSELNNHLTAISHPAGVDLCAEPPDGRTGPRRRTSRPVTLRSSSPPSARWRPRPSPSRSRRPLPRPFRSTPSSPPGTRRSPRPRSGSWRPGRARRRSRSVGLPTSSW